MRTICTAVLALATLLFASAGKVTVKGKVTDASGIALERATVSVKGSSVSVITGSEGDFSIELSPPATLVFAAVGYASQEFKITEKNYSNSISIALSPAAHLEEVVVTGYSFATTDVALGDAEAPAVKKRPYTAARKATHAASPEFETSPSRGSLSQPALSLSKLLTAGELNDFKKWKLWGDYTSSEFSSLSEKWQMVFRQRYCVQVQNSDRKAVVGEKVYLIDHDSRDTVWKSFTDNTGKAELWGALYADENSQASYFISCGGKTIAFPRVFERGVNQVMLKKACSVSKAVDLAFVVDATGSMGDEIRYLQAELADIIENVSVNHKDVSLRLGSVFYRDHGDAYLTRHTDLQADPSAAIGFIGRQVAGGGGDYPEAVESALQVALDSLSWSGDARARIIFLVLDAPPHDAAKQQMRQLVTRAAAMGIRVVPVACSGVDKSTEYLLRCIALATNGSYVFLTDDSGIGNPHIKPTTDEFKVELLNELVQRLISEMIEVTACTGEPARPAPEDTVSAVVKMTVYPNPTSGRVMLQSTVPVKQLYLTDFAGKLLQKIETREKKRRWAVNLDTYPSGTYLLKYFNEGKGWGSEKIVLIH